MTAPTLAQVFGQNAVQNATTLTITKADLSTTGFTPSATNTADSLLAAILAFAEQTLTPANQSSNPEQSVAIADSFDSITLINTVSYRVKTKSLSFQKPDTGSAFNPNDY